MVGCAAYFGSRLTAKANRVVRAPKLVRLGDQTPEVVVPAGKVARLAGCQLGGSYPHVPDFARVGSPL